MPPCRRRRKEAIPHCYWGGSKQGGEVTRRPRSPEEQEKHSNAEYGGGGVKMPKKSTSGSRLDAREVEAVAMALKSLKGPPPARIWTRGRWWQTC
jgi:hypothetical protein